MLQKFTYHSVYFSQIFHFKISWEYITDLIFSIWVELMASESKSTNLLLILWTSSNYDLVIGGRIFSGHHSLLLPICATTCNRNYITKGESTRSGFSVIFFIWFSKNHNNVAKCGLFQKLPFSKYFMETRHTWSFHHHWCKI